MSKPSSNTYLFDPIGSIYPRFYPNIAKSFPYFPTFSLVFYLYFTISNLIKRLYVTDLLHFHAIIFIHSYDSTYRRLHLPFLQNMLSYIQRRAKRVAR
mgnify:CR=1 FL=1